MPRRTPVATAFGGSLRSGDTASDSVAHTRAQSILRIRSTASDAKRPTPLTPLPSPRPLSNLVLFRPPPVRFPTTTRQNGGRVSPDDRREEPPKAGSMRGADLPRPKVLCKRSAAHPLRKDRAAASRSLSFPQLPDTHPRRIEIHPEKIDASYPRRFRCQVCRKIRLD